MIRAVRGWFATMMYKGKLRKELRRHRRRAAELGALARHAVNRGEWATYARLRDEHLGLKRRMDHILGEIRR